MKIHILILSAFTLLIAACTSTPVATTSNSPSTAAVSAPLAAPMAAPVAAPAKSPQSVLAHLDPSSLIYKQRSVYFDYDLFNIKSDYTALIERHAQYLKAHPELEVKLEGNADERGGHEYNLSLGQRRSESVKRALITLGATAKQLEAVSFGEEKPVKIGHDEASWAENRRVDFVYATKK